MNREGNEGREDDSALLERNGRESAVTGLPRGLAGWLLGKWRASRTVAPRLAVLERVALAQRQSLALVEAEGRRFLVATSAESSPVFYALDEAEPRPDGQSSVEGPRRGRHARARDRFRGEGQARAQARA